MRNFIQPGKVLTLVAGASGVTSGDIVVEGKLVGVAATSAVEDEEYELNIGGVYESGKVVAEAWAVGDEIFVTAGGLLTSGGTGNTKVGIAAAVAENPSGTGRVRFNDSF